MHLDPTIIRTRTCSGLLKLLSACKKYLNVIDNADSYSILALIEKAEKVHKEEIERVGYRKDKED